jgi:lysine-specific demethylase 8
MRPDGISQTQWLKFNIYFIIEHFIGSKLSSKIIYPLRKKLFDEVLKSPDILNRAEVYKSEIYELESFSPDIFKNDLYLKQPIVFRGAAKDWPAVQKWDKSFFRSHYENTPVTIIDNPGLVDNEKENTFRHTTFGEYFDEVEKDPDIYLRFSRVLDHNPVLLKDLNLDWLQQFRRKFSIGGLTYLFIGEENSKTSMHAGQSQTIFIGVKGRKKWTICAPNERFFLDPCAERLLYYYTNAVPNNDHPNVGYDLVPYIKKYEFVLEEGDVLWLPSFFWHFVENLTPTIGVAYKYTNFFESFKITKSLTTLHFLATKPSLFQSFFYNKVKGNDFMFNAKSAKYQ